MVTELRYGLRAGFQNLQVIPPHPSSAMSLRGTSVASAEDMETVKTVAAVGLLGVSAIGEAAVRAVRAASCDRRRGRSQVDADGNHISPPQPSSGHLSIVSQPESSPEAAAGAQESGNGQPEPPQDAAAGAQEPGNGAGLEEWKADKERMQNIIQQQSEDASKLLIKMDEMKKAIDKLMAENLDLKKYMDMELEKIVSTVEHGYHVKSIKQMEKFKEDYNAKITILELQLAKTKAYTDTDEDDPDKDDKKLKLKQELEFQKEMYPLSLADAMRAEMKTSAARGRNEGLLNCQIGSTDNLHANTFSDEQVGEIIQASEKNKKFIIVKGTQMYTEDALKYVDGAQRNRVLNNLNTPTKELRKVGDEKVDKHTQELLDKLQRHSMTSGYATPCNESLNGSTPPRTRQSPATHNHNHSRPDDSEEEESWAMRLSVINRGGKDNGPGGGGGGDDGDHEGEAHRRSDHDKGYGDGGNEFTLVNPRNIEMKRFTGEPNSKMSYLEFNDSQRELTGIKGKEGDILNSILTWAEQK